MERKKNSPDARGAAAAPANALLQLDTALVLVSCPLLGETTLVGSGGAAASLAQPWLNLFVPTTGLAGRWMVSSNLLIQRKAGPIYQSMRYLPMGRVQSLMLAGLYCYSSVGGQQLPVLRQAKRATSVYVPAPCL